MTNWHKEKIQKELESKELVLDKLSGGSDDAKKQNNRRRNRKKRRFVTSRINGLKNVLQKTE